MSRRQEARQRSMQLATGGLMTALSVVGLYLAGLIQVGTYAGPLFGGLVVLFTKEKCGGKTAWLQWLATGLLTLLLSPDKELALIYLLLAGWYPLVKEWLDRRKKPVRLLLKLAIFNLTLCAVYAILLLLVYGGDWAALGFGGIWLTLAALAAGNVICFLYDVLLVRVRLQIRQRLYHKKL